MRRWWLVVCCACGAGAGDATDDTADDTAGLTGGRLPAPEAAPWPVAFPAPALDHGFFDDHPALADVSTWTMRVDGPEDDRPDHRYRGAFGVGNGHVFAMAGLTDPLNTLHGMLGPIYRKESRFFGDTALLPVVDGAVQAGFDVEQIARPRGTSLAVVRAELGDLVFTTVDVAPRPAGAGPYEVPPAIVRFVLVQNTGDVTVDVGVAIDARDPLSEVDGVVRAAIGDGDPRVLGYVPRDGVIAERQQAWTLPLGEVAPGGEVSGALAYVVGWDDAHLAGLADDLADADWEAWLDETVAAWRDEAAEGLQLELDDVGLVDLVDGMWAAVRVQQAPAGGISPLSRYTGTWLRDTIGPVRMFTRMGRFDVAEAAMTYLELCHRHRGDVGNSCSSGLHPDEVVREVVWEALPPFEGRTRAEGPSYVPLGWREIVRWTGRTDGVVDRWDYLTRTVMAQEVTEDGLQRWSGDETFRLAMNVALGQTLEFPWEERAWSSNSALVMMPAARFLAEIAEAEGLDGAAALSDRADLVQQGLEATFVRPAGHFAAVVWHDDVDEDPLDAPYEDAALKALWSGAYDADDDVALAHLRAVTDQLGRGDGTVISPPHRDYEDAGDVAQGVGTGMLPGFVLWTYSALGDPEVRDALDAVRRIASPSGQFHEGFQAQDFAAFQPTYDARGVLGDVAARFRPWEGGIVVDAVLYDLLGAAPSGTRDAPALRLRPRVPSGLDHMRATGLAALGSTVDVTVAWDDGWTVEVAHAGSADLVLTVEIPLGVWEDVAVAVQGPDGPGEVVVRPQGERMAVFAPVTVAPGETVTFDVRNGG